LKAGDLAGILTAAAALIAAIGALVHSKNTRARVTRRANNTTGAPK